MATVYLITCGSKDENGICGIGIRKIDNEFQNTKEANEQLCQFLNQTQTSYIDNKGFVHEIFENEDQIFGKYIDDIDPATISELYSDLDSEDIPIVIDVLEAQLRLKELPDYNQAVNDARLSYVILRNVWYTNEMDHILAHNEDLLPMISLPEDKQNDNEAVLDAYIKAIYDFIPLFQHNNSSAEELFMLCPKLMEYDKTYGWNLGPDVSEINDLT